MSQRAVEVCGLIGGRSGVMETVYPVVNVAAEPRRRFEMDAVDQLDAMRQMAAHGEAWLGIYHSHVKGPALPSRVDLAEHAYPEALCLIVAPGVRPAKQVRAFSLRGRLARELPLVFVVRRRSARVSNLPQY